MFARWSKFRPWCDRRWGGVHLLLIGTVVLTSFFWLIEAFFYPGLWQHYLKIPVGLIAMAALTFQAAVVAGVRKPLSKTWLWLWCGVVATSVMAVAFYGFEQSMFTNFVFSTLHLHPVVIRDWALFLWASLFVALVPAVIQRDKLVVTTVPVLLAGLLLVLQQTMTPTFIQMGTENGFVEVVTFVVYAIGIGAFFYLSRKLWPHQKGIVALFGLVIVALIVLAGEEVAWGKWLFNFETPEYFMDNNMQQETTLHNLKSVQDSLWYVYMLVGFVGGVIPLLQPQFKQRIPLLKLLPPLFLSTYFIPLFLYGVYRNFIGPISYKTWEESAELLFAMGLVWYVVFFPLPAFLNKTDKNSRRR